MIWPSPATDEFDYGMDNFLSLAKDKAKYDSICAATSPT